ncbi:MULTISPECIES: PA2779 family protein [Roseateles]|uniref:PA2779 family protein n=1 Tax=Pelomonas caseinilytica TaxID=2906763 RepID=A0ABS8XBS1_9BURK|nr:MULTISPECIES: PA2779 family protein [unclassified Roseateles]MCE4538389.1 PA2779 family protein [Pelomonas sp. P7]HEV6966916.1 PA2779 family protein [Roseateles sp.]
MKNKAQRVLASVLVASLVFSGMAQAAPTALISTEQAAAALQAASRSEAHARLQAALDRADLAAMLQARGVSVDEMRARVDALTDAEAQQMLQQIDSAPAGSSDVLGVLFTVFIILLVTDILGLTKVFPFTRSVR